MSGSSPIALGTLKVWQCFFAGGVGSGLYRSSLRQPEALRHQPIQSIALLGPRLLLQPDLTCLQTKAEEPVLTLTKVWLDGGKHQRGMGGRKQLNRCGLVLGECLDDLEQRGHNDSLPTLVHMGSRKVVSSFPSFTTKWINLAPTGERSGQALFGDSRKP
jgi:hypothetical protein